MAIHAKKGEKWAQSKRTAPTTKFKNLVFSKSIYQLISYYVQKGDFKNLTSKPSWTLRGGFNLGGENFKSWKCFAKSYSFTFDHLQKNFEKDLQKNLQKQNMWCNRGPKCYIRMKAIHAYLVSIYIGSIPSNLCTYIMQTSSIMHFYICFGLCWHQSPKRGRLKGN